MLVVPGGRTVLQQARPCVGIDKHVHDQAAYLLGALFGQPSLALIAPQGCDFHILGRDACFERLNFFPKSVAEFIASLTSGLGGAPPLVVVASVVIAIIFLTELTSNTATTATLVPILAALAPGLGVHPYLVIIPAAIAASCAFMMPVATPPNAIVFASGHVTIPQMCKAGMWLNFIGIILVTFLGYAVVAWWLM